MNEFYCTKYLPFVIYMFDLEKGSEVNSLLVYVSGLFRDNIYILNSSSASLVSSVMCIVFLRHRSSVCDV